MGKETMNQQDAGTPDLTPCAIFDLRAEDRDPRHLRFVQV